MYPNLYYAFKDLFGIEAGGLRFINSFGFFVAIAFLVAASLLARELKRKSKAGLLQPSEMKIRVGEPARPVDLIGHFVLGFILGYKIISLFFADGSATADPQAYIFSGEGSLPLGLLTGLLLAGLKWWEKKKAQLERPEVRILRLWPEDRVGEITVLALVFGIVGAKLFDIFENWSDFLERPSAYLLSPAGLTFYGGLICATAAIIIYARRHKIPVVHLADAIAPPLMIAYGIGRIGCHVAGDGDWGIPNTDPKPFAWMPDWLWAYNYPHNVNEVGARIPGCEGRFCFALPQAVFPTPLYETIAALLLFGLLWALRKRLKVPGTLFALYLIFNGLERFFIEKIRVNNTMSLFGLQVTQAEVISSLLVLTGLLLWVFLTYKYKARPARV